MVSSREIVKVRLEVDFELIVGELRVMEDDLERMELEEFVRVWEPEMKDSRIMLKLIDLGEVKDEQ